MDYNETLDYLFNAMPAYQSVGKTAYKDNLDNTHALMAELGQPQKKLMCVHVAGTNGKGSVSHILASIFQSCGYRTGLYTSPHLVDFRERIRVNGTMISEEKVIAFTQAHKAAFETIQPSFFEMTVGMAFDHFVKEAVDIAIIETGLGGRLDSTNIIKPEVSVITNISIDHADILGDTLEKIAVEKAGIIKENIPTVLGFIAPALIPVFADKAKELNSPLHVTSANYKVVAQKTQHGMQNITFNKNGKYGAYQTDVLGACQAQNIATVLQTVEVLQADGEFEFEESRVKLALERVKKQTGLKGRWETMKQKPLWVCDTAHNEAGLLQLMGQVSDLPHRKKYIIFGCVDDKAIDNVLDFFDKEYNYIFTTSSNARSLDSTILLQKGKELGLRCQTAATIKEAITLVNDKITKDDVAMVCGSTFLVADALKSLKEML